MITNLDIMIWGQKAGTLVAYKRGHGARQACFYFDDQFAKRTLDIAPLRAPLSGTAAKRGMPVYPEEGKEFSGLPSFVADSMPDHWGNTIFAEWIKARGIRAKDLTSLDRLAFIGRRGMGALEFVPPASAEMEAPFRIEVTELSQLAQTALKEAKRFHAMSTDLSIESLFRVGTSAGGRRPKAVINVHPLTGECYSGQTPAPLPGFLPMIIKFDEHTEVPTTRIEYSYYLMAQEAGLKMMPSKLIETERETHFLTERFDRRDADKIHTQTLAAMNPYSSSYEDLFDVAAKLGLPPDEMRQLFLQMVLNVASGNVDDHNKNFSFTMDKDGIWHAAPAYDFTFAVDTTGPFYINRHSLTINGKSQDIDKTDFIDIAHRYDIKNVSAIIEAATDATQNYRKHALQAGVPKPWIARIEAEIAERQLRSK